MLLVIESDWVNIFQKIMMSLSKLKERLKHYKSSDQLHVSHEVARSKERLHDYSQTHGSKISKAKRQIESRLVTEINQKIITSKEELRRFGKALKLNPKSKKTEGKSKVQAHSKLHHFATSSTKRPDKERMLSPVVSKFKQKTELTETGSPIAHPKDKKGLRKVKKQQSQTKWKLEYTECVALTDKGRKSKSREPVSRQKSRKKLQKAYTEVSLETSPSSAMTDEVQLLELIGEGTFGKVFKGRMRRTRQIVAVKRVLQDSRYKNRELQIVKMLRDDFVCEILGTYITQEGKQEYLNILMHYYEENLFQRIKGYPAGKMPGLEAKIIIYQLLKGLSYLHSANICHRDIKPENVLLRGNRTAICDFGSAKALMPLESNISYICARCYRAPELIFGATQYSTQVDVWSAGCVILEILHGDPLFIGETSISHLLEIIKKLGTPTPEQVLAMNPEYDIRSYCFPSLPRKEWKDIFPEADPLLLKLLAKVMVYSPEARTTAVEALSSQYFDELRDQLTYSHLSSMYHLGEFFSFSRKEVYGHEHLMARLVPKWYQRPSSQP